MPATGLEPAANWLKANCSTKLSYAGMLPRRPGLTTHKKKGKVPLSRMAAMAGFEPANQGVKVLCLATWLHRYIIDLLFLCVMCKINTIAIFTHNEQREKAEA